MNQTHLELLCLIHHSLDVVLAESALVVCDSDLVVLAGALVLCPDVEDAVGVHVERDLNLGHTSGGWGDVAELEFAEQVLKGNVSRFSVLWFRYF